MPASTSTTPPRAPGFVHRALIYFGTMFPLPKAALAAVVGFGSFFALMAVYHGDSRLLYPEVWFAVVTLFLYSILFRLHDELKDRAFDQQFNPQRPLVTGRVKYSDIRLMIIGVFFMLVALNFDRGRATSAFLLLIVFLSLSARWFYFPEQVQKHFGLLTITHQTILPLVYFYVYTVYLDASGNIPDYRVAIPLFLLFSLPNVAWEIARKTRAPSEENDYPSYSSRWGVRRATLIPMGYVAVATGALVVLGLALGFSTYFLAANLLLGGGVLLVFWRFLRLPVIARNRLRLAIETYDFGFRLIILAEVGTRFA